jgi:hypothetical protein
MAAVPVWVVFVVTTLLLVGLLELGYRLGTKAHRRSPKEKESPVSAFAGAMLALLAFMLGFTFNLASERYQRRREVIREEVMAIQTAYLGSDVLPEPDRHEAKALIADYLGTLAEMPTRAAHVELQRALAVANPWHRRLWALAMANARADLDSNIGALYVESINRVFELRAERAMLDTSKVRIPIWTVLYGLMAMAMLGVAYQSGIAGSRRSKVGIFLAVSLSLVVALIADLDHPSGYIVVSHESFEILRDSITSTPQAAR